MKPWKVAIVLAAVSLLLAVALAVGVWLLSGLVPGVDPLNLTAGAAQ